MKMFQKGTMRDSGAHSIDITIKNNPDHVLAPDDWDMVMKVKFEKITPEEYKKWYASLLKKRWNTRRKEFTDLLKEGKENTVILKCFCSKNVEHCHAYFASNFLNSILEKIK